MSRNDKVIDINRADPSDKDIYLIDTNILIKILYPIVFDQYIENYERFYARIRERHSKLLITSVQISEFINRCIRFQFHLYKEEHSEVEDFKKDYRGTSNYLESMQSILEIIENDIIPHFQFVSDKFDSINKGNIFKYGFSYDFNDALLTEIAKSYAAIIVTDDRDFSNYINVVPIITGNKKLLNFANKMS